MKEKFNKNKNFFLVFLSILVICLSLTLLYEKFIKNNNVNNSINNEVSKEIEIVDYVNYSIDKGGIESDCVVHGVEIIKIPMIKSDKQGAVELNNKIKNNFKIYIDATNRTEEEALNSDVNYAMNYSYEKYQNYVSLKMIGGFGPYCGTSPTSETYYYTYDVKNDEILSNNDLLNLAKVTKKELLEKVKNDITTNYPLLDVNSIIQTVESDLNSELYNIYITEEGLIKIEIKYETYSLPLTYSYKIWKSES